MKWKFAPVSFLKNFAAGISVFTMCISPVAQGATAMTQKQKVNKFLKETGLTRQITVGEYWKQFRHVYPLKFRKKMDQWAFINRKELMPAVEATSFKDKDGKEQVRVTLSKNKQSVVITYTGDEEKPLKVNGISLSKNEIENLNSFTDVIKKLAKQDKTIAKNLAAGKKVPSTHNLVLDFNEYKKLTVRQKAEYFIRLRKAMEASQQVYQHYYGDQALQELNKKYEWVVQFFFGADAEAKGSKGSPRSSLTGKPCVVAGYLSIYGENNRCGGATRGWDNLTEQMTKNNASCPNKEVACNPMVYGFKNNGDAFCVPRPKIRLATQFCNGESPLQNTDKHIEALNKKRIIETYLYKAKGQDITLTLNDKGEIEASQYKEIEGYLKDINQFIASAVDECDKDPLKGIQESRSDQVSACDNIRIRAISLQSFVTAPVPFPPVKPNEGGVAEDKVPDCDIEKPGSLLTYDGEKHSCECPEKTNEYGGRCNPTAAVVSVGPQDNCDFWCKYGGWMAVGAVAAIGTGLYFWLSDDDKDKDIPKPVYVPPAGVPEPVPTNPITNPPIEEPPLAPIPHTPGFLCLRPMRIINGVCTLETIVVPPTNPPEQPAKPTEGGDKKDAPGRASGIR